MSRVQRKSTLHDVVERVAAAEGVRCEELEPLYWSVDPAVYELIDRTSEPGTRFEFQYEGYTVVIDRDGGVSLGRDD